MLHPWVSEAVARPPGRGCPYESRRGRERGGGELCLCLYATNVQLKPNAIQNWGSKDDQGLRRASRAALLGPVA